jgi:hypothetical protein
MEFAGQLVEKPDKSFTVALTACCVLAILAFAALLSQFGISPIPILLVLGAAALFWVAVRYTVSCLGAFLAAMPFFTILFLIAKFAGPSYIGQLEGIDRAVLLMLTVILWSRNGIRLLLPDWLLLISFGVALLRLPLDGSALALVTDFGFMIAYAAGRVTPLSCEQQGAWAKRAVWIIAIVSVLGLAESLFVGPGPRTILYLKAAEAATDNGEALNASFRAVGFNGLRVSGTMFGPLQFGPLCMAALIIWWVYSRKPLWGCLIGAALIGTLTRSAWVGTAVAIPLLAIGLGQKKRVIMYGVLALALFLAAIPVLGLSDYLSSNKTGDDPSAGMHQASMFQGIAFTASHPIGQGSRNVGRQATKEDPDAVFFEDAYLTLAGEYGIPTALCLVGFLVTTVRLTWRQRSKLGYTAAAIVTGFGTVLMFASLHDVFPLACWVWFPVGLAVSSSVKQDRLSPPFTSPSDTSRMLRNGNDV